MESSTARGAHCGGQRAPRHDEIRCCNAARPQGARATRKMSFNAQPKARSRHMPRAREIYACGWCSELCMQSRGL